MAVAANDKRLEPYSLWKRLKLKNKQKNAPTNSCLCDLVKKVGYALYYKTFMEVQGTRRGE